MSLEQKEPLVRWRHRLSSKAEYLSLDVRRLLFVLTCVVLTFVVFTSFAGLYHQD
jgi:hypothetical protein